MGCRRSAMVADIASKNTGSSSPNLACPKRRRRRSAGTLCHTAPASTVAVVSSSQFLQSGPSQVYQLPSLVHPRSQRALRAWKPPDQKQCSKCLMTQPATCFANNYSTASGLNTCCIACVKAAMLELQQSRRQVQLPAAVQAA